MKTILTAIGLMIALAISGLSGAAAEHYLSDDSVKGRHIQTAAIHKRHMNDEAVTWRSLSWQIQRRFDHWTIRYNGQEIECQAVYTMTRRFDAMECE